MGYSLQETYWNRKNVDDEITKMEEMKAIKKRKTSWRR